jgi:predicted MFS family arabinose efflux permease
VDDKKNALILILMVGVFGILNTEMGFIGILPYISESYQVSIVHAGLLVSLFATGVAIAGPTMPLIFSRFNRKHVMLFVLGLFTVCNAISIFAANFEILLAARVLPAFFHPVYCSMAFTVASALAGEKNAPKAVAKINIGVSAGMVVGVPISNFLAENISLSASMTFFALVTLLAFIATFIFVPSMPVYEKMSYGSQLKILKKPIVWASIIAIIFCNGSIFSVFNYLADYLSSVAHFSPSMVSSLLFVYGICNILGSIAAGKLLTIIPSGTIKLFPFFLSAVYFFMFQSESSIIFAILIILWGLLGGINANISQFWMARTAPQAPDFANGLFLTAANLGVTIGTPFSGIFIDNFGMAHVIFGGIIFSAIAAGIFWTQFFKENLNPLSEK